MNTHRLLISEHPEREFQRAFWGWNVHSGGTHIYERRREKFEATPRCDTKTAKKYRPESLTMVFRRVGQVERGPHVR